MGCVDGPPPSLGGFDELEDHGQSRDAGVGAAVTLGRGPKAERVDSTGFVVRGWSPVFGGEVVGRRQLVLAVGDLLEDLGNFAPQSWVKVLIAALRAACPRRGSHAGQLMSHDACTPGLRIGPRNEGGVSCARNLIWTAGAPLPGAGLHVGNLPSTRRIL